MKHRLVNNGFGANSKILLDNKGLMHWKFAIATSQEFFLDGFDYHQDSQIFSVGIEPTYQYDDLKIISIAKKKEDSTFQTGRAFGPYGSNLVAKTKRYGDYKRKSKFTRFVDEWHSTLFPHRGQS